MYLATSLPWWFRAVTKIDIQAIEIAAAANLSIVAHKSGARHHEIEFLDGGY